MAKNKNKNNVPKTCILDKVISNDNFNTSKKRYKKPINEKNNIIVISKSISLIT
jgi:hypothetical protein